MNHQKTGSFWLLIVFVVTAGIIFLCDFPIQEREEETGEGLIILDETAVPGEGTADKRESTQEAEIFVYVCGCVNHPGVYRLTAGARVFEAVDAAGGACEDADTDGMNLAQPVSDGERIYVPEKGEQQEDVVRDAGLSLININQASAADLVALPGIGQSKANAIINYRLQHGGFSSKEELLEVPGIKEGIYDQIEALITVK